VGGGEIRVSPILRENTMRSKRLSGWGSWRESEGKTDRKKRTSIRKKKGPGVIASERNHRRKAIDVTVGGKNKRARLDSIPFEAG